MFDSIAGPIVSALVNRFGTQRVTIAGGLIAFVGSLMSAFQPSLYFMYFSHSFVSGNIASFMWVGKKFYDFIWDFIQYTHVWLNKHLKFNF